MILDFVPCLLIRYSCHAFYIFRTYHMQYKIALCALNESINKENQVRLYRNITKELRDLFSLKCAN